MYRFVAEGDGGLNEMVTGNGCGRGMQAVVTRLESSSRYGRRREQLDGEENGDEGLAERAKNQSQRMMSFWTIDLAQSMAEGANAQHSPTRKRFTKDHELKPFFAQAVKPQTCRGSRGGNGMPIGERSVERGRTGDGYREYEAVRGSGFGER